MCSRTTCSKCKKPTWTGCGAHIEQALAGVPKNARCTCRETAQTTTAQPNSRGFLSRLFG